MVEQEHHESHRSRIHENGSSEEADSIVARHLPKDQKDLRTSLSFELSVSLLYRRVHIGMCRLLLLCTLTRFIPPLAHA